METTIDFGRGVRYGFGEMDASALSAAKSVYVHKAVSMEAMPCVVSALVAMDRLDMETL